MTLPATDKLNAVSRDELIALIGQLVAEIELLRAELDKLKTPPTTSRNSSQPPSRDWKREQPADKRGKKRGAQPGHAKAQRSLVDNPDMVIEARVTECPDCGADLRGVAPQRIVRRQVTEVPELRPVVIETQQHEVTCPGCQRRQRGTLPEGLEASRQLGPRLEARVTSLHHEHHMGFERLGMVLQDVFGIGLSEGGAVAILERAGTVAQPAADAIGEQVRQSKVIGSDETSARVNGGNWWEWVFTSAAGEYHLLRPSRGHDVIAAFMGDYCAEVWQSDWWQPQLNAPAEGHQLCLPHQIRNRQRLIDQRPRLQWAWEMQDLFRTASPLGHRRDQLTVRGFQGQVTRLERRLHRLLARPVTGRLAVNLRDRYRTHRNHLFVFLYRADVAPDNNACERALCPSVIHRKVLGSFRSEWGPRAYAALATVIHTAKRTGENVFQKLAGMMGKPVLHYLDPLIA
jgi:transposase